jgi:hypothetical protein
MIGVSFEKTANKLREAPPSICNDVEAFSRVDEQFER